MAGDRDLQQLLGQLHPEVTPGRYVFCSFPGRVPAGLRPVVTVAEPEGITAVVEQHEAEALGLDYAYPAVWITLRSHSVRDETGRAITTAVAGRLAEHGIGCSVVAGFHHDHLFVTADHAEQAVRVLERLAAG
ncbi:ACT domain-containing protein [Kitasatospora sp. RB6PN24]|uniref:ACT domain-containing protein n=1 Tax=Kitasatospora humi TaxID=2893891 RepID=UPI001E429052|nr:ACT domain-containing protein [Kitasatospora humi]MCC9308660.1 ACT domain-containing protein [Kitasatospora humi]